MTLQIHLIAKNVSGDGTPEGRCPLPSSGVSRKALTASPACSRGNLKTYSQISILSLVHSSKEESFVCKAKSKDDKSPTNKRGSSLSRKSEDEEIENIESSEGHKVLNTFRSIHSKLREGGDIKEEENVKTPKQEGKAKESKAISSLLNIIRKHAKMADKSEINGTAINGSNELETSQSPITQEKNGDTWKKNQIDTLPDSEEESDVDSDLDTEIEFETKALYSGVNGFDDPHVEDGNGAYVTEGGEKQEDLTALKMTELRELAKSRGLKKFSKLKKDELIELLSSSE